VAALIAGRRDQRTTALRHLRAGLALPIESLTDRENLDFLVAAHALSLEQSGDIGTAMLRLAELLPRGDNEMTLTHQWLPSLVRLALAAGDRQLAQTAAQACHQEAVAETRPARAAAASLRCFGLLESDPDRLGEAVAHYRIVGPAVELPAALEDLAVVLAGHGHEEEARAALNEGVGLYEDIHARWDIRRASARLRPYGIKRGVRGRHGPRVISGWASLTPAELKVATLVAAGASTADIARDMFLSRRTVQTYISRILVKLDAKTRVDIVREALRQGVSPLATPATVDVGASASVDIDRRGGKGAVKVSSSDHCAGSAQRVAWWYGPSPEHHVGAGPHPPEHAAEYRELAPHGVELRHLRYFIAVADAGTFTQAAERMYVAQPTLSQQIRRLEEMVGAPLLQRCREGVRLTDAGTVFLEESRTLLSMVEHGVSLTRHAAGIGRPRLRVAVSPDLPEVLAAVTVARVGELAADADVDVLWVEALFDTQFTFIGQHRADAGFGWLAPAGPALPATLDATSLGDFEPEAWIPLSHPAARQKVITLAELARLEIMHGPRRASSGVYDAWRAVLRSVDPRFEFADQPFPRSLPLTIHFAATASRPTAVLTGPHHPAGQHADWPEQTPESHEMARVRVAKAPLTASAALVWNGDLPRQFQEILFDAAAGRLPACLPPALILLPERSTGDDI
jgi:DNA-binding transcriptional LysR family regulator/DNA-binding CsgD family transcriptional regulator